MQAGCSAQVAHGCECNSLTDMSRLQRCICIQRVLPPTTYRGVERRTHKGELWILLCTPPANISYLSCTWPFQVITDVRMPFVGHPLIQGLTRMPGARGTYVHSSTSQDPIDVHTNASKHLVKMMVLQGWRQCVLITLLASSAVGQSLGPGVAPAAPGQSQLYRINNGTCYGQGHFQ